LLKNYLLSLAPIFAAIINFLVFMIISQVNLKDIRIRFLISIVSGFLFLFIGLEIIKSYEIFIIHSCTYLALSFVIWNIFMLSATAQRIRILIEVYHNKKIKLKTILSLYNTKEIYKKRIKRLKNLGIITVDKNSNIKIKNKKFYYINMIVNNLRKIIITSE
jgi:hypothetical protein